MSYNQTNITLSSDTYSKTESDNKYRLISDSYSKSSMDQLITTQGLAVIGNIICTYTGLEGGIQCRPAVDGTEASISFFRQVDGTKYLTGDSWRIGSLIQGVSERNFGIACNGKGALVEFRSSDGLVEFKYGINCNAPANLNRTLIVRKMVAGRMYLCIQMQMALSVLLYVIEM